MLRAAARVPSFHKNQETKNTNLQRPRLHGLRLHVIDGLPRPLELCPCSNPAQCARGSLELSCLPPQALPLARVNCLLELLESNASH